MADETTTSTSTTAANMSSTATVVHAELAPFHPVYQLVIRNNHANEENTGQSGSKEQTTTEQSGTSSETASDAQDSYFLVDPIGDVTLSRERKIAPSKLTFKAFADGLDVKEGNAVEFSVNGTKVFKGFLFEIRRGEDGVNDYTCYDQLRYLKNKDCIVYRQKTAADVLKQICEEYGLEAGDIANTQYKIPLRIEDNKTLADILQHALDETLVHTADHAYYTLYDDAGKVMLQPMDKMKLDDYVDASQVKGYTYTTSIDKDTYDVVKVVREAPGEQGKKLVRTGLVVDEDHIKEWGRLQYLLRPDNKQVNAMDRAKRLIMMKNRKSRDIKLTGVLGDIRVRGGSLLYVDMRFADQSLKNYFLVDSVTHHFAEGLHTMDITLFYNEKPGKYTVKEDNDRAVLQKIKEEEERQKQGRKSTKTGNAATDPTGLPFGSTYIDTGRPGIDGAIARASVKYNVSQETLHKMVMRESGYDGSAVSSDGAHFGCMQISQDVADQYGCSDVFDYEQNIDAGAHYYSDLLQQAGGDERTALAMYNGGPGTPNYSYADSVLSTAVEGSYTTIVAKSYYQYNGNGYGGVDPEQVQTGFDAVGGDYPGGGYISPYGENGCVDVALKADAYANADCAELARTGVSDVPSMCQKMEERGYTVSPYDGNVAKGDLLIYGDYDHVTIADAEGGCFGNSSSLGYPNHYDNLANAWRTNTYPNYVIHLDKS